MRRMPRAATATPSPTTPLDAPPLAQPETARLSLHEWSCLRTELVWIYDGPPREQARHMTSDHREGNWVWLLRSGTVTLRVGRQTWHARPGQWLLLPNSITQQDFSSDAHLLSIRFFCQWPDGGNIFTRSSTSGSAPDACAIFDARHHPELERTATRLERLVRRHFPFTHGGHHAHMRQTANYPLFLQYQRAFLDWLAAWFETRQALGARPARLGTGGDERIWRTARALNDAPLAAGFPDARLRAETGLGAVQTNRLFRDAFGVTPRQQWEQRRLETARLLLETTGTPLKELTAQLGFRSDAHFVVWFRRRTRLTPGRYRRMFLTTNAH
ncbi:AraC family transcriptional regulator [Geminisphaera colitermitum]|uniref:AraC family transcriptional regulator n=1 Tax=Geminisphaera colitermitum TaxID=1148786 RepID=UPI000158D404|nr:helix-turn-helix domain-containing protein [Geminisphaera colitermitum]